MLKNRLDFGGEDEPPLLHGVVERLDTEEVARAKQLVGSGIVNSEREHAAHPVEHTFRPGKVPHEQNLGV